MWCFLGNHSFNMFESPARKKFLHALHPAYKAPPRKTLSGPLLDKVYEMTKTHTNEMISGMQTLNIVTDESSNIQNNRICNISLHTPSGRIHYVSEDIQSKQMTATAVAQWLRNHLVTLTKGDIACINSIITDTCKLMFKMWLEIQKLDEFKHVFFIPCDSHSDGFRSGQNRDPTGYRPTFIGSSVGSVWIWRYPIDSPVTTSVGPKKQSVDAGSRS